jgi:hypothetical protein
MGGLSPDPCEAGPEWSTAFQHLRGARRVLASEGRRFTKVAEDRVPKLGLTREEDRTLRAVLVGVLREGEKRGR